MNKLIYLLPIVAMLGGCAEYQVLKNAVQYAADATVPPTVGLVAANSFDGLEATATDILRSCTPGSGYAQIPAATCSAQRSNILTMEAAVKAGRPLRDAIEPTTAGAVPVSGSVYNKLEAEISALQTAINNFNSVKGS